MVKSDSVAVAARQMSKNRMERLIGWLLFALVLALYLRMLAPGLLAGDPGEFQVAAWRLGLAHPTGYPLYLLLGGVWQRALALFGVNPATALNALSAVLGAAVAGLLYRLMMGWLRGPLSIRRAAALLAAVLFAVNPTFWNQSLIAEVYALHALFVVVILLAAQPLGRGILRLEEVGLEKEDEKEDEKGDEKEDEDDATSSQPHHALTNIVHNSSFTPILESDIHHSQLFFLIGLSLTHHATTVLLLPGLLLSLWWADHIRWRNGRAVALAVVAALLPLLLYLYIPLRSGAAASPWYHQNLGDLVLHLYDNSWRSFVTFMTGQSISAGFRTIGDALAQIPFAARLWWLHFSWAGLVLVVAGLFALWRQRRWDVFAFTVVYALCQQIFNLFYNIGDIYVYYIPLYLMGTIWAGFAAASLGRGEWQGAEGTWERTLGVVLVCGLFLLPLYLGRIYGPQVDQSRNDMTRQAWETILAAQPPADAILVSNDRNEIVPLFYLQAVEQRATAMAGLFPLIAPDARFVDIGTTLDTALAVSAGRPIYLIKPMPGLDVRFALADNTPPLVQVLGPAVTEPPAVLASVPYGMFTLIGYDWMRTDEGLQIDLQWRVETSPGMDLTSTVQLYDANGEKLGQDDHPPGGVYYPTSLWKTGELLRDRHRLAVAPEQEPVTMLVGMYTAGDGQLITPMMRLPWGK